jgi:hypothetical protein
MTDLIKYSPLLPVEYDCLKDYIIELTSEKVVYKIPAGLLQIRIRTMKLFFRSVSMDLIFDRMTGTFNKEFEIYHCYFFRERRLQSTMEIPTTNKFID